MLLEIYMIRGGSFGFDFEVKLIMSLAAIAGCLYDWRVKKRRDYFWVFLFGTLVWAAVELAIQLGGTRTMLAKYLFGMEIPLWVSIPLQAMSESGAIAVMGVFFGDRLADKKTVKPAVITFAIVVSIMLVGVAAQAMPMKNVGGDVPSRRDMFTPASIIYMSTMIAIVVIWSWKTRPERRVRALWMLVVMIMFAAIWTSGEFIANTRWIEVGTTGDLARAPSVIEFLALTWDVVVEIAAAYVPYLIVAYKLKCIK
jgi:hypothetical protein